MNEQDKRNWRRLADALMELRDEHIGVVASFDVIRKAQDEQHDKLAAQVREQGDRITILEEQREHLSNRVAELNQEVNDAREKASRTQGEINVIRAVDQTKTDLLTADQEERNAARKHRLQVLKTWSPIILAIVSVIGSIFAVTK